MAVPLFSLEHVFFVEKQHILEYNELQKNRQIYPGMCEAPFYFEPTMTLWDSYIADRMSDLSLW